MNTLYSNDMSRKQKKGIELTSKVNIDWYPHPGLGKLACNGRTDFLEEVKKACQYQLRKFSDESPLSRAEKIIIVGEPSVGKTCLIKRYCENTFSEGYKATIGVDFLYKQYSILGRDFTLHIWDTAGQEQFRCISRAYFRGATAVLIAFDVGDKNSFSRTKEWLEEVKEETQSEFQTFLIGLKADLFHIVTRDMAEDAAIMMNAEYWECSAKTGANVNALFERIATVLFENSVMRTVHQSNPLQEKIIDGSILNKDEKQEISNGKCCK